MYVPTESEVNVLIPLVAIAPFVIPAVTAGLGALANIFGGNRQQQGTTGTSTQTGTGTSSNIFNRTTTAGLSPEFQGIGNEALSQIFNRLPNTQLDPSLLTRQENIEKQRVNRIADRVFSSARGGAFNRGLANSPSANILAGGLAEGVRGQGISGVAQNFAQQRFNLPRTQEELAASQRATLLDIFRLLPRTATTSGEATGQTTRDFTTTNVSDTTAGSGNFLSNLLAGLLFGGTQGANLQDLIFGNGTPTVGTQGDD